MRFTSDEIPAKQFPYSISISTNALIVNVLNWKN